MRFVTWLATNALAVAAAAALLGGIWFEGPAGGGLEIEHKLWPVLLVALIMGAFIILTIGLFLWVINALMLLLTAAIAGWFDVGFHVDGFLTALLGALIITLVNGFIDIVVLED